MSGPSDPADKVRPSTKATPTRRRSAISTDTASSIETRTAAARRRTSLADQKAPSGSKDPHRRPRHVPGRHSRDARAGRAGGWEHQSTKASDDVARAPQLCSGARDLPATP